MDTKLFERYGKGMHTPQEHATFMASNNLEGLNDAQQELAGLRQVWTPEYEATLVEIFRQDSLLRQAVTSEHLLENALHDLEKLKAKKT